MEKRLVWALVLISGIMFTGNLIMGKLYPPVEMEQEISNEVSVTKEEDLNTGSSQNFHLFFSEIESSETENIYFENDLYQVIFSTQGAVITSLQLKAFTDNATGDFVELILPFDTKPYGAFTTYVGSNNNTMPVLANFQLVEQTPESLVFSTDLLLNVVLEEGESRRIRMVKQFDFRDSEYLFKVSTTFESLDEGKPLPAFILQNGYTVESIPQLGPAFEKLDQRDAYRRPIYLNSEKKRTTAKFRYGLANTNGDAHWASIIEKYFLIAGVPTQNTQYNVVWTTKPLSVDNPNGLQLNFIRKNLNIDLDAFTDELFYYLGPKQEKELLRYNNAGDNAWGLSDVYLNRAMESHVITGLLINLLKGVLSFIYGFVGNWGWAIVILTVIVKLILLPSSISSAVSMSAMTKVQPKLKALQEQYKDDKQELAKKQMELYQKEGVNPAGGCLPILVQMPILLALFSLFNQYFELRGAPWILWVTDLSAPDQFFAFSQPLPLLQWTHLNLLPIFYVGTQILTTVLSMKDNPATTQQMKTMMWMLPLIFFFMLYNMPSGLFLYWTVSNILGLFQQLLINAWRKNGTLDRLYAKKEAKRKKKSAKRATLMAAYQKQLNQSKGKNK
ncbi:membrane protein insertase YidC [Entomospira nematocerorum]|uniref:Membrane protein insertase YidC n=1 Tax=Entomospira nematocerorum TaxID=2719987 RepID=A0A968GCU5_9SPIO|nr:membrane protein insertase YidC [Entomospira nematocera]NIZ46899.1 membrane protein insertase YidC [Entomospira nematocera]WDI33302.1 membrane protein insertase YidC [Entomospira nematocera]